MTGFERVYAEDTGYGVNITIGYLGDNGIFYRLGYGTSSEYGPGVPTRYEVPIGQQPVPSIYFDNYLADQLYEQLGRVLGKESHTQAAWQKVIDAKDAHIADLRKLIADKEATK